MANEIRKLSLEDGKSRTAAQRHALRKISAAMEPTAREIALLNKQAEKATELHNKQRDTVILEGAISLCLTDFSKDEVIAMLKAHMDHLSSI